MPNNPTAPVTRMTVRLVSIAFNAVGIPTFRMSANSAPRRRAIRKVRPERPDADLNGFPRFAEALKPNADAEDRAENERSVAATFRLRAG